MSIELKIPEVGESVREVQIGRWLKAEGDFVAKDENLVELETDKASMELPAPSAGVIGKILKHEGDTVAVGDVIGHLEEGIGGSSDSANANSSDGTSQTAIAPRKPTDTLLTEVAVTPAARRALREHGLTAADMGATGARIDRDEVLHYVKQHEKQSRGDNKVDVEADPNGAKSDVQLASDELEEIVPMSLIRRRIAERLVQAQQQAALLTTFNEIDMTAVKRLRAAYRESFQEKYGVKLGFTSFFVKAVVDALKAQPGLNAEIRANKNDKQIVYRRYYHIGIAIGSGKGLVVPVLRFAERLSFAEIELAVEDFARRATDNKLKPDELQGGTFTITNGGVFGSLLSTPIVNPPQSGVLGMHAIQDRPVAREGQVVIRPMMYVALTYDHRIVDGREAVVFLQRVKDVIEDPSRILLET